jgi:putative membrane protein
MVAHSFTAHMLLHMSVVGIGVPLLAAGVAPWVAGRGWLRWQVALGVSLADFAVVWGWHAPMLHHAARSGGVWLALEQASFAVAAMLVWLVAFAAPQGLRQQAALVGGMTLFMTSMHMTLLGALIALAPRVLYPHHGHGTLEDQQLGGAVMLTIGAVVYLGGALLLFARVLRPEVRG